MTESTSPFLLLWILFSCASDPSPPLNLLSWEIQGLFSFLLLLNFSEASGPGDHCQICLVSLLPHWLCFHPLLCWLLFLYFIPKYCSFTDSSLPCPSPPWRGSTSSLMDWNIAIGWWFQISIFSLNLFTELRTLLSLLGIFTRYPVGMPILTQNSQVISEKPVPSHLFTISTNDFTTHAGT